MTALHWFVSRVELHHNAILAIAALMSPFAAIWLGMRQTKANLQTTKLQIRATVGVAYRQQLHDELRNELSAQLDCLNSNEQLA